MKSNSIIRILKNNLRPTVRLVKRSYKFISWCLAALHNLNKQGHKSIKRVLAIYDTTSQPFSVGDLLICLEASLIVCKQQEVSCVDLAFVYSEEKPDAADPVFKGNVTRESIFFHLASILPLAQVNQYMASVFVFNSQEQLNRYITDNVKLYHIWPSAWLMSRSEYLSPVIFNTLLRKHYREYGSIPHLTCRTFLKRWAVDFYKRNLTGKVPITVNLRNNKGWALNRNSHIESWISFFKYCEEKYKAVFIIICSFSEIDDTLRQCGNIIIAKDYHTGVEQDMALIHTSAIHMGAGSGPATMAWFNNKPYLMVNTDCKIGGFYEYSDMIEQVSENIQRFWFSAPMQHIASGIETPDLLIREFEMMWTVINEADWQSNLTDSPNPNDGLGLWLR